MLEYRGKLYQAYHAILSLALSWALSLVINQYFVLKIPVLLTAATSFLIVIIIYLFDLFRKNVISYIIIGSILPITALIFLIIKFNPYYWFVNFINWCNIYNGSDELYQMQYAYIVIFCTALLGAILFYIVIKKGTAKILLAVAITVALIVLSISKINISKAVAGISIFYILTVVVEVYGAIYSKKTGRENKKEGILYLAPICLLLAVLSVSLPSKQEPIRWIFIKNAYKGIREQFDLLQTDFNYYFGNSSNEFGINLSGYTDHNGILGNKGRIAKDNRVALKASKPDLQNSVYLIGSVSNIYTGHSWEKSPKDYIPGQKEYLLDYAELVYAITRQNPDVLKRNRFIKKDIIEIEYNNIKTKTLFYPLKTGLYDIYSKNKKLLDEQPQITFGRVRGKGTSYKSIYMEMNLGGSAFKQMLREADSFSYDNSPGVNYASVTWLKSNALYRNITYDLFTNQDYYFRLLKKREALIQSQYTALPNELPGRVKDLANEITADDSSTYDKLKAIEAYLKNYKYTLNPKKAPKNEDFIDYFLFDSKEGYCTSFATAMAILGRCIGVPTRYVEGFVVTYGSGNTYTKYPVKNNQAHAWAEAYINGVGWIPFEATAPYYDNRYTKWPEVTNISETEKNDNAFSYDYYSKDLKNNHAAANVAIKKTKDNKEAIYNVVMIFFACILILLLTAVIYFNILRYSYKKAFKKADYNKKMYMLFLRILNLLGREGYALERQETILMLSERVKDYFCYDRVTFKQVAYIYMRYRYAQTAVTEAEFNRVNIFFTGLATKQRQEEKRFHLWMEEFIFLTRKGNINQKLYPKD